MKKRVFLWSALALFAVSGLTLTCIKIVKIKRWYDAEAAKSQLRLNAFVADGGNAFLTAPAAGQLFGEDLRVGPALPGNFSEEGNNGRTEINIPVAGSSASGLVYLAGTERKGVWKITEVGACVAGQRTWHDILHPQAEPVVSPKAGWVCPPSHLSTSNSVK